MEAIASGSSPLENRGSEPSIKLIGIARDAGFDTVGSLDASHLVVRPEVRAMCAVDRCHAYGKNWVCPPACGSLDTYAALIADRGTAIVVQTVARLEDEFDIEGMQEAEVLHKQRFAHFAQAVRTTLSAASGKGDSPGEAAKAAGEPLFLAAGTCTLCPTCTYPDAPCRFPTSAFVSLEAAGLVVSEVCESAGIPYYHGKGTLAYTSCVLV
ncbi:DUF2284 domain-containing protein [Raoultibacter phocaeensis]|uniref:DUF2284 domain-containing protein n=1 Tax=Raoultibacter phocaeensis TaxID=2479841 RepID=UPI001118497F|nr:DUF2284 domain-containing protein [Raoultibacter phocaeensis]